MRNLFCEQKDLTNEASVEEFFLSRLLKHLGYRDSQIKPKTSLKKLAVSLGSKRLQWKPDYAIQVGRKIRWIVEAKAPSESLDDHIEQCSGYCLALNRNYNGENPVRYFLVSNGKTTRVYQWDRGDYVLELDFSDFTEESDRFRALCDLLEQQRFSQPDKESANPGPVHTLRKRDLSDVNADFAWCHQFIYKKDNLSQSAAFMEFVKLVFLKLLSDRDVHAHHPEFATLDEITLPAVEVRFSKRWIEDRQADHPNPIDALQFQALLQRLEAEIQQGERKRIFDRDEKISLTAETIHGVVERLEGTDLFGIDADLNGRLFETFLNATMRGKDLGQFFTPRSVVKLATRMADLRADRERIDIVLDACCGSGGFLIEALADMWDTVDANESLSDKERIKLRDHVAKESIYGIDVARNPNLARIARMNMYLHGDGGASIFQVDALDKAIEDDSTASPELKRELVQLRELMGNGDFADVILTNPPFAKEYERKYEREAEILDRYELGFDTKGGARKKKASLRSSVMFLERYHDLLKPGGRLVTVVDDSILGGVSYKAIRSFIREKFIIRAVVSLPGDAFQRSKARVKTSLFILEKRAEGDSSQPGVFMTYCTAVGIDDSPRQRTLPGDREKRAQADREIAEISQAYRSFLSGSKDGKEWVVPAERIADRMDVKNCLLDPNRSVEPWKQSGFEVSPMSRWITVKYPLPDEDVEDPNCVQTADLDDLVTQLRVRYDGFAEAGETIWPGDSAYQTLYRVHKGDLAISNINAVHGAVAVVPEELDGCYVTSEYTVCRAKEGVDARVVWTLLRSPEARANLLLLATGIGRSRVKAEAALSLQLPVPDGDLRDGVAESIRRAEELELEASRLRAEATKEMEQNLSLDDDEAKQIIAAFKPPR